MVVYKKPQVSALFRARRLVHANIFVTDLDRSMEFYKKVVGLEEVYRKAPEKAPDAPAYAGFLGNGNTHHDVALMAMGRPPELNHFAFELESEADLLEGYQLSVEAGQVFQASDHDVSRSLYSSDPDGNGIEIYADITKEWRTIRGDGRTVRDAAFPWTPGDPPRFGPAEARNYHEDPEIRRVEEAIFHPKRITHALIVTEDLARLCHYYTTAVGFELASGSPDGPYAVLSGTTGGRHLTLFRSEEGRPAGLHHFGFEVWDEKDLDESESRLRDAGLKPAFSLDHPAKRSVFIRDPDGFLIEFYVDRGAGPTRLDAEKEIALYLG